MPLLLVLLLLAPGFLPAAEEPVPDPDELPRIPPVEAADALATFQLRPGIRLELAAAEPEVTDPVALDFDAAGRLYVAEMRGYSEHREEALGRVRRLEDRDGDGRLETSVVFARDLRWPTAVLAYGGGVFVGATPDILFLKDHDGDGVADERRVVFTGFGAGRGQRLNVQALLNSFRWGPDNRVYGATAGNGGTVRAAGVAGAPAVRLDGRDFSFDPRTLDLRAEGPTSQHGFCFDDAGRVFTCSNSNHLRAVLFEPAYAGRNPHYAMPRPLVDAALDGPAAEVYRISPDEPWRVVRTRWRVAGRVPGPVEGGGRVSGYFTAATGVTVYRGDALPGMRGDVFVGDAGSNLVHRKQVRYPAGVQPRGSRPAGEPEASEFIASRDNWFRPVQFAHGPDGALYIADMYRETIEHPWSIPQSIKAHLDLDSGRDRGRIWRVVPVDFRRPGARTLAGAGAADLVAALGHPNGWHRDTAARLLTERAAAADLPLLRAALADPGGEPAARAGALRALHSRGALDAAGLAAALAGDDEPLLLAALRVVGSGGGPGWPGVIEARLEALAVHPSAHVRYRLALALSAVQTPGKTRALAAVARRGGGCRWTRAAVMCALAEGAADLFMELAEGPGPSSFFQGEHGRAYLRDLAGIIGRSRDLEGAAALLGWAVEAGDPAVLDAVRGPLGAVLSERELAELSGGRITGDYWAGRAADRALPVAERAAALRLLARGRFQKVSPVLVRHLGAAGEPDALRESALGALGSFEDPGVAGALLDVWDVLPERLKARAVAVMLARESRVEALLGALESGRVSAADLDANHRLFLAAHPREDLRRRAVACLGPAPPADERVAGVLRRLSPALGLAGDAVAGGTIFRARCQACHRLRPGAEGGGIGPDVVSFKDAGPEAILLSIIDPSRQVAPGFELLHLETRGGESFLGRVIERGDAAVVLLGVDGVVRRVSAAEIASLRSLGRSLMPEGLEAGLGAPAMADLLAFLAAAGGVGE